VSTQDSAPIVSTTSGPVRGVREAGLEVFLGIPYAAPPIGDLRWRPAQPHPGWAEVRDAVEFGPSAPQPYDPTGTMDQVLGDHGRPPFDEDCLTLNVWTPGADDERRPVLVWIHGGGFISGSGSLPIYQGDGFAATGDLVVVTINYRIGALGFLAGDRSDESNFWLTDQTAALRWVHENAERFGGDPQNITVAGESGGAFSAAALAVQPATAPLIKRVILQSAPLGLHCPSRDEALETTRMMLELAGVDTVDQLATLPTDLLVGLTFALMPRVSRFGYWTTPFMPIIDGISLTEHPLDAILAGAAGDIDVLIGWNADEATFAFARRPDLPQATRQQVEGRIAERFGDADAAAVYDEYAAGSDDDNTPLSVMIELLTDELFRQPAFELADARVAGAPVWAYHFAFASPAHGGKLGATHCLELPFTFANPERWTHAPFVDGIDAADFEKLGADMHAAWIGFIRTGSPNTGSIPAWPAYGADREVMVFDRASSVATDPLRERRELHARPGAIMRSR
jgi:para-nitrobenzyl esterase